MEKNLSDANIIDEIKKRFDEKNELISKLKNDLQTTKEKLFDSEHIKTKFLSIIRNELKNPVSAISGLSKLVAQKDFNSFEEVKTILHTIQAESLRFSLQLDNILTAASFEGGENYNFLSLFDINELIEEVVDSYSDEIKSRDKKIETDFFKPLKIYADKEKIKLVLKNLFDNCIKFSEENIKIKVFEKNKKVILSFFNDGYEINKKNHNSIFQRFHPLDSGLSRKHCGTGLGLCVCAAIAENHGGKIDFSSGNGKGTVFDVELPLNTDELQNNGEADFEEGFVIL
jgi:signal transduction histidine kinase